MVKNLPAMWETWFGSLVGEDPLAKGMATHSSILAWRIPWTEEPGRLQSMESQESGMTDQLNFHANIYYLTWFLWIRIQAQLSQWFWFRAAPEIASGVGWDCSHPEATSRSLAHVAGKLVPPGRRPSQGFASIHKTDTSFQNE